jgi:hypothetical protein
MGAALAAIIRYKLSIRLIINQSLRSGWISWHSSSEPKITIRSRPRRFRPGFSSFRPSDLTGDDAIVALAGDDVVEGDSGNDIASLGDGSDRFIWNPGDGDDIVDGGDGSDTLEFNGSAAPEFMTVMTLATAASASSVMSVTLRSTRRLSR